MDEYIDLERVPDEEYKAETSEMMATRGWKLFLAELYELSQDLSDLQAIDSLEALERTKGKLDMIGFVLNYERIMEVDEADPYEGS